MERRAHITLEAMLVHRALVVSLPVPWGGLGCPVALGRVLGVVIPESPSTLGGRTRWAMQIGAMETGRGDLGGKSQGLTLSTL